MTDFHLLITDWYRLNKRDLPWRNTRNPYLIWLSEIILQQTRVDQGLSYYLKFSTNYPTISDLALAPEEKILRDWQGLGYYSRARNLHFTAKKIHNESNGIFPSRYDEIKALKGIGDYTAAAIASFAFNLPHAVVDGNVYRVLSRIFNEETPIDSTEGKKIFQLLANELIDDKDPATFNQAIMELGALICTPVNPKCLECPMQNSCQALTLNTISQRPVKTKKTKVKHRYFHFLIYSSNGQTVIEQRTDRDIWQNLFQFPLIESDDSFTLDEIEKKADLKAQFFSKEITHILSHQKIHARFYHFDQLPENKKENWKVIALEDLDNHALPRLIHKYLEENWQVFEGLKTNH